MKTFSGQYDNQKLQVFCKFAHKIAMLLLCMERSETQVATSSLTMIDERKCSVLFLAHRAFMHNNQTAVQ